MKIKARESKYLRAEDFETTVDGKPVRLYTLVHSRGVEMTVTNYGAKIVSLHVPDKNGKPVDIVLGKSNIGDYLNDQEPYFGAICGRTANRIADARFTIDDVEYNLNANNGRNSLHGGPKGFHTAVWDAEQINPHRLHLSYLSPDGEEGYPGNLKVDVTYQFITQHSLEIKYKATTDKPTLINLTNHSYFNLSGEGSPTINDHRLRIGADSYLPTNAEAIPFGPLETVYGTPFDFTSYRRIGDRIDDDDLQLKYGNGYDHNYVSKYKGEAMVCVAHAMSPVTGIVLSVYSTEPGLQLYTGNYLDGSFIGKNGHTYPRRSAFCLETQHHPDSIHHPDYPSIILRPGEVFESKTLFGFAALAD
jgi:aldose 1-epimerase